MIGNDFRVMAHSGLELPGMKDTEGMIIAFGFKGRQSFTVMYSDQSMFYSGIFKENAQIIERMANETSEDLQREARSLGFLPVLSNVMTHHSCVIETWTLM